MTRAAIALVALVLGGGCQPAEPDDAPAGEDEPLADTEETLTAQTQEGPVSATVTLAPAAPRLGDPLALTLSVQAQPGVGFDMPEFGEALGRFPILDFAPTQGEGADGGATARQRYTLQAPMSGRQRIPGLRIEYLDERDGPSDVYRELITDEIAFEVESVLPSGAVTDELLPARGALPEQAEGWLPAWWPWAAGAALGLAAVVGGALLWQQRALARTQLTAYDRALRRLQRLEGRGWPEADAADAWYVELSDVVRRYVEDRYAVRAPELTTEEFLLEARRSVRFSAVRRQLLSAFLERCDRVKFARYSPDAGESSEALATARRFLDETRATATDADADAAPRQPASATKPAQQTTALKG